jgi:hypothetical protein
MGKEIYKNIIYKICFILLISLFFIPNIKADMKGWLKDSIYSSSSGYHVGTQAQDYYFGGGFGLRTPQETIVPFHLQPPSIKAGCGGIDIAFGGFSYLNPKYLVDFAQKVLSAAPAMAFQMALQTFCSSCEGIMNKLTSLANMVNGLNMNSCEAARTASKGLGMLMDMGSVKTAAGKFDSWLSMADNALGTFNNAVSDLINGDAYDPNSDLASVSKFFKSDETSFLAFVIKEEADDNNILKELSNDEIKVIRYLFGDIVKYERKNATYGNASVSTRNQNPNEYVTVNNPNKEGQDKNDDKMPAFQYIGVKHTANTHNSTIRELLNAWIYGYNMSDSALNIESQSIETITAKNPFSVKNVNAEDTNEEKIKIKCDNTNSSAKLIGIELSGATPKLKIVENVPSICSITGTRFKEIADSYNNYKKLTDEDLKTLSYIDFPVYKLLNAVSILPGGVESVLNEVIHVFTVEYLTAFLQKIGQAYSIFLNQLQNSSTYNNLPVEKEIVEALNRNINETMKELSAFSSLSLKDLQEKITINNTINEFAVKIQAQIARHPIAGNYFFSPFAGGGISE